MNNITQKIPIFKIYNLSKYFKILIQSKIAIATAYGAEITARLQADSAKYQWYGDQYAKLSAEYGRGLAVLTGGGAQQGGGA